MRKARSAIKIPQAIAHAWPKSSAYVRTDSVSFRLPLLSANVEYITMSRNLRVEVSEDSEELYMLRYVALANLTFRFHM
uniref:Neur_chan_LBD domain-containing protein n=1 Tax=Syphacia muris TaxID=451379 RepID=A0A0N5ATV1_9BILA